ncbi:MAG: T9SS type A sorting domain-containing protein [candidate division WOR-3 bacterium]|nr:MAG: T9SS type A sorting domain-containing protein [candidate division WOR-3 bacterium]
MNTHNAVRITLCCLFLTFSFLLPPSHFLLFGDPPDTLWARTFGGADIDVAYSVCETSDGGYIATGYTNSFGAGQQDAYLVRTNSSGDVVWTQTFGGASMDGAHFVREASDQGYVIAGYSETFGGGGKNMYLIKTDSSGQAEWTRTYATPLMDVAYAFCETPDSGYIFIGYKNGPSGWVKGDLWILKTDATLDTIWTREYGGAGEDYGVTIQQTLDGNYIIAGITSSFGANGKNVWIVKIDSNGDTLWTKVYGNNLEDVGYGVCSTSDGGYIVTGYINGTGQWTAGDLWLLKTDANGDTLWTKVYGTGGEDFGFDVYETPDGGYVVAGRYANDMWLLRTDASGDTIWTAKYGGGGVESALALGMTSDGGYIIGGYTTSFGFGANDFWIIKTEPDVGVEENNSIDIKKNGFSTTIISGQLTLPNHEEFRIYDISGRTVNRNHLSPGIYFIEIDGKIINKVIKVQ